MAETSMRIFKIEDTNISVKQKDKESQIPGAINPAIDFKILLDAYEGSFIIGGIIDKIAKSCASGFEVTGNEKFDVFLSQIDLVYWFTNMLAFGNLFLEKVKTNGGKFVYFDPILTYTMRVKSDGTYVQTINKDEPFAKEDVAHIKRQSLRSKRYGDSILTNVVTQITLLQNIDTFYEKLFDRGLIYPFILNDEENKLTDEQCKDIQIMINDGLRGLENSFRGLVLPTKLSKMDLTTNIDNSVFMELRNQLIKAICVGINYPYGLVINDSANRATSDTEFKTLQKEIITPLQNSFLIQFKKILKDIKDSGIREDKDVDALCFKSVDTKNQLDEMKKWTGYKTAGILTTNEIREQIGRKKIEGGDVLETRMTPEQTKEVMDNITKKIGKIYNE